jgi:hypothetical protein
LESGRRVLQRPRFRNSWLVMLKTLHGQRLCS